MRSALKGRTGWQDHEYVFTHERCVDDLRSVAIETKNQDGVLRGRSSLLGREAPSSTVK